jgi:hypothetical protein
MPIRPWALPEPDITGLNEVVVEVEGPLGGMNVSQPASLLRNESPFAENVVIENGVVRKSNGLTELGTPSTAANKHVMAVAEFKTASGVSLLMRVLPDVLERWNGSSWQALTGALGGSDTKYPSVTTASDLFLVANGVTRIKSWNGSDLSPVTDLSASAPVAHFLALSQDRLIAADIVEGATRDPERIMISRGGDITNFADPLDGDDVILPEDPASRPSPITGLSALFGSLFVYRKHSIWTGIPTGASSAPFTFRESAVKVGLIAPRSLASYPPIGDIFLGPDMMVYVFSGGPQPSPVGIPVQPDMKRMISQADLDKVYAAVDVDNRQYWLIAPTSGSSRPNVAWVWNIKEFTDNQRLVWTRRSLGSRQAVSVAFASFPRTGGFIDDEQRFIDDISEFIDEWQQVGEGRALFFGGTDGTVRYLDQTTFTDQGIGSVEGIYTLPEAASVGRDLWLDTIYLKFSPTAPASVEVSVSLDGGGTFLSPTVKTVTGGVVPFFVGLTGERFMPRVRFLGGPTAELISARLVFRPRGTVR